MVVRRAKIAQYVIHVHKLITYQEIHVQNVKHLLHIAIYAVTLPVLHVLIIII
jgi:hypothetical protein